MSRNRQVGLLGPRDCTLLLPASRSSVRGAATETQERVQALWDLPQPSSQDPRKGHLARPWCSERGASGTALRMRPHPRDPEAGEETRVSVQRTDSRTCRYGGIVSKSNPWSGTLFGNTVLGDAVRLTRGRSGGPSSRDAEHGAVRVRVSGAPTGSSKRHAPSASVSTSGQQGNWCLWVQ